MGAYPSVQLRSGERAGGELENRALLVVECGFESGAVKEES